MSTDSPQKVLALFDLDGTLTKADTFLHFLTHVHGRAGFLRKVPALLPTLAAYALRLLPKDEAKRRIFSHYFGGRKQEELDAAGHTFSNDILPSLLRPEAAKKLEWHCQQGHDIAVVSASSPIWLQAWADAMGIALIATEYDTADGSYTGRYKTPNCRGAEKVSRIREHYRLEDYDAIYAYGNSSGDREMLAIATHPFYRKF